MSKLNGRLPGICGKIGIGVAIAVLAALFLLPLDSLSSDVSDHEKRLCAVEARYEVVLQRLDEMQADLKELLRRLPADFPNNK